MAKPLLAFWKMAKSTGKDVFNSALGAKDEFVASASEQFDKLRPDTTADEQFKKLVDEYKDLHASVADRVQLSGKLRGAATSGSTTANWWNSAKVQLAEAEKCFKEATSPNTTKVDEAISSLKKARDHCELAEAAAGKATVEFNLSNDAMAPWQSTLSAAKTELTRITALPGAEKERDELAEHIKKAEGAIGNESGLKTGYHLALAELAGFEAIGKRADASHKQAKEQIRSKDYLDADNETSAVLNEYVTLATDYSGQKQATRIDEIKAQLIKDQQASGGVAPNQFEQVAIDELKSLGQGMQDELISLRSAKQSAETYLEKLKSQVQTNLLPTEVKSQVQRNLNMMKASIDRRDWEGAVALGKQADSQMESMLEAGKRFEANLKHAQRIEFDVGVMKNSPWEPVRLKAQPLVNDCNYIRATFDRDANYQAFCDNFEKLEPAYRKLLAEFNKLPSDPKALVDALNDAKEKVQNALQVSQASLAELDRHYQPVVLKKQIQLRERWILAREAWDTYSRDPFMSDPLSNPDSIAARGSASANLIQAIQEEANALRLSPPPDVNIDFEREKIGKPALIASLIAELEVLSIDRGLIVQFRRALESAKAVEDTNSQNSSYDTLLYQLNGQLAPLRQNRDAAIKDASAKLQAVKNELKKVEPKGYREALQPQLQDAQYLVDSGDPDLVAIGKQLIGDLEKRVHEATPAKNVTIGKNSVTYEQVKAKWAHLSEQLNNDEKKRLLVDKRLPDTHKRLRQQLINAVAQAEKLSPNDGFALLSQLEEPIQQAIEKARLVEAQHVELKERVKKLDKAWDAAKDKSTTFTESAGIMNYYIESGKKEIEALRHTETGMPAAEAVLAELENAVNRILTSDDPRSALHEQQVERQREKMAVQDQGKQFAKVLANFKDKTLKETEKTLKARAEQQLITPSVLQDSLETLKGLEEIANSAKKIVKPFVDADAPDPKKAIPAFATAHEMLAEGSRTAARLASATITTNINLVGDFIKLERVWTQQVQAFQTAIEAVLTSIDTNVSGFQPTDQIPQPALDVLQNAAAEARKLVGQSAGVFKPDDFAKAFGELAKTDSNRQEKLASREVVLKRVHAHMEVLLKHPVLRKLTEAANPFEQKKIKAATGYLRSALQSIELEALSV